MIILHADDYGLSEGITDNILLCHDQGALNRVSIMANGYAYDYACQELKQRPSLTACVHLNLLEGTPLTDAPLLINPKTGLFNLTFISILNANNPQKKQILSECIAQILHVKQSLSMTTISIDSHQHCHMIPWLFEALNKEKKILGITLIRCAIDNMRLSDLLLANPVSITKNILLKTLYKMTSHSLERQYKDLFWGVLYTGKQNDSSLKRAYQRNKRYLSKQSLEVLLHPGQAKQGEEDFWKFYPKLLKYYYSSDRLQEQQTLLNLSKQSPLFD